jgi:hypothetical protein
LAAEAAALESRLFLYRAVLALLLAEAVVVIMETILAEVAVAVAAVEVRLALGVRVVLAVPVW